MAQAPVLPRGFELPLEPRLPRVGSVDAVALEERAASLAKRSIKKDAKVFALELAVRMMDLTTLEGQDTPGKVAALASKAIRPDPADAGIGGANASRALGRWCNWTARTTTGSKVAVPGAC